MAYLIVVWPIRLLPCEDRRQISAFARHPRKMRPASSPSWRGSRQSGFTQQSIKRGALNNSATIWSRFRPERRFTSLLPRSGEVVGYQSLDLYSRLLGSMAHVGQLGTFIAPEWRRRGAGQALFQKSVSFAGSSGYRKIVIQVRALNISARSFYQHLGFVQCGRLSRQVVIEGQEDDEIIMELFL